MSVLVFLIELLPFKVRRALCMWWAQRRNDTETLEMWAGIDRMRQMKATLNGLGFRK